MKITWETNLVFKNLMFCMLGAILFVGLPNSANGGVMVAPGYDLLDTVRAEYNFGGAGGLGVVSFRGDPLNNFDFGSGAVDVDGTDTILRRLAGVNLPDLPPRVGQTIDIEMVALSLQSTTQLDWSAFGGIANEYVNVSLVADTGSTMTIFNDFTFDSELQFLVQFEGEDSGVQLPGPVQVHFMQTGATWQHIPKYNNVLIDGINNNLNGSNHDEDFFTGYAEHGPDHIHVTRGINSVPEPSSVAIFGFMATFGLFGCKRRRRQTA